MAEKRVLTNPDLLQLILSFLEKKIIKNCAVCDKVIQYHLFNQNILSINIQHYINLETCEKKYFCSEECLIIYLERYNNLRFCLILFWIMFLFSSLLGIAVLMIG
jgi:hypothetical protein